MTVMTSREFNQDSSGAKKAAAKGPVFITDRGKPSHVLLTIEEYSKLAQKGPSIAELFYSPGADEIEFEPPRIDDFGLKPADFS
ncbi:type II toxin-antitoxin system Phd/YefM family antitoxin [Rhizobium sp. P32RR-XVIII]|uniref:type II toxin-antitoxin system prevent-host-death family antitoxin n=1 Tax=Rhizobium sp. P32RR-XVIII TaxID=2726738 RepID=UPI001456582F|nr:type II toxin-antitoxin system prevent-host-death family antitoxin [Rhizobium sp. P32RR-XVIII]NLS04392.1 type II toxin-antitoxin system Phd/YefM family antitoxin [Rhizobium sp. P32RR-XVIII]